MDKKRVVITGTGVISPVGNDTEIFWNSLKNGISGIGTITSYDTEGHKVTIAGEVKDFDPTEYIDKKEAKRMDRFTHFAIAAAKQAVENAGLDLEKVNHDRFGVVLGSGIGGLITLEKEILKMDKKGPGRLSPFFIPMIITNIAAGNVSIALNAKGPSYNISTACASGTNAIGDALRMIQHGKADLIMAGGTEAAITASGVGGFASMTALSTRNDDPQKASRPFDRDRDGFIVGEGAGMLLMESLEHAKARGANILAEVVGYGATSDAYHITMPAPGGEGGARALELAIEDAGISPADVGYINAHGTSTPYNDRFESAAIETVFGEHKSSVSVSSTKSMTGHLLGAAGAIEAIVCIQALREGFLPPTINLENRDPECCDLDYVPNEGREKKIAYAASNSLGFGGHNATIVLKKWSE